MSLNVKWILFDFGGCLDSDGQHSRTLFLNQFKNFGLISTEETCSLFQEAYTYSDNKVIDESLVANSNLLEMNETMCFYIAEKLHLENFTYVKKVAEAITEEQSFYLKRNKLILEKLHSKYKLGIISNFSGNLTRILDEFHLTAYFTFVLDSYHVGAKKPHAEIFGIALKNCETNPNEVCFVGDNPDRDIIPSKALGMKAILITQNKSPEKNIADYTFASLEELLSLIQMI